MERIHDVFTIGYFVGYRNCMDLVWILNPYFNFDCLPPFGMDAIAFFMETRMNNPNPYKLAGEFVIPCHAFRGLSSSKT